MKAFEPHKTKVPKLNHPEEVTKIVEYLSTIGDLNIDASCVESMWYDFSSTYESVFLIPCDRLLKEFAEWLSDFTKEQAESIHYVMTNGIGTEYREDDNCNEKYPTSEKLLDNEHLTRCDLCEAYPIELIDFNLCTNISGYSFETLNGIMHVCADCYEDVIEPIIRDSTIRPIPIMRYNA